MVFKRFMTKLGGRKLIQGQTAQRNKTLQNKFYSGVDNQSKDRRISFVTKWTWVTLYANVTIWSKTMFVPCLIFSVRQIHEGEGEDTSNTLLGETSGAKKEGVKHRIPYSYQSAAPGNKKPAFGFYCVLELPARRKTNGPRDHTIQSKDFVSTPSQFDLNWKNVYYLLTVKAWYRHDLDWRKSSPERLPATWGLRLPSTIYNTLS